MGLFGSAELDVEADGRELLLISGEGLVGALENGGADGKKRTSETQGAGSGEERF